MSTNTAWSPMSVRERDFTYATFGVLILRGSTLPKSLQMVDIGRVGAVPSAVMGRPIGMRGAIARPIVA